MAKLTGKAKAAFLARMNKGRIKAGLKKIGSKATKKVRKAIVKHTKSVKKHRNTQHRNTSKRRKTIVAKKGSSKKKSRFAIPSIVKKAAAGIGLATIATVIVNQFAPQAAPIVRPIAAFAGGGVVGVISDIFLSGGLGNILGSFGLGGQVGVDSGVKQSV